MSCELCIIIYKNNQTVVGVQKKEGEVLFHFILIYYNLYTNIIFPML